MLGFPGVIVGPIVIGLKLGEALGISVGNWLGAPDCSDDGEREGIEDGSTLGTWLGPLDGLVECTTDGVELGLEEGHCVVGAMVGFPGVTVGPSVVGLELGVVLGSSEG